VGAGKTSFARALIRALIGGAEDIPSPTFTLVQTYETPAFEIWHADLYRLTMLDEVEELGLTDAFDTALCLIEWPDRLGPLRPENSLSLDFAHAQAAETRTLHLSWTDPRWDATVEGLIQ